MNENFDVIIIGAGPAGLSASIYTGRGRLKTLVLEKGLPGGQILTSDWIENYPGFPKGISPFQLMDEFRKQAEHFGAVIRTDEVKSIKKQNNLWLLSGYQETNLTRAVIIATGSYYRKLGVEGENELTGRGVSYCATCDAAFFKDKEIAVVGGGNNALTEAIFLAKFGKSIKVIHRRDELRGEKILQERIMSHDRIDVIWDSVVTKINGKDKLEGVILRNVKDDSTHELKVDGLFISIGTRPNSEFLNDLVELDQLGFIKVDDGRRTNQESIFAAGDVSNASPKQVATASGSGVNAAISVSEYIQNLDL
ncbi:MAG: thioredoxin-disulfide reductase [Candidatus Aminicenantes bacterium]|nr:thioredoxin-disulfide reductase [Candidatus Aminicenantes bacterium]